MKDTTFNPFEYERFLVWRTMPAVAANRNFYVTTHNDKQLHVVFSTAQQKWCCQINHKTVKRLDSAKAGKLWFQKKAKEDTMPESEV